MTAGKTEKKLGSGAIFRQKDKKSDKHPEYTGNFVDLEGKDMRVALWVKESKSGLKYFSMSISKKDESAPAQSKDDDDELPF